MADARPIRAVRRAAAVVFVCALFVGCGAESEPTDEARPMPTMAPTPTVHPTAPPTATPSAQPSERHGIDVSHHQGTIDWTRVAADGIEFAYLKATEGSGFIDSRFATNASQAKAAGLDVGGYHYYTLCSPPEPQARHFATTIKGATDLPPVVDLELIGNCDPPPARQGLAAQVKTFIDMVEEATGEQVVVYFHPDFEKHYGMVDSFARPLWVRRVGDVPPPGAWHLWQRSDRGHVDGISTPVDLDVMR